jgi:hypothetical protein
MLTHGNSWGNSKALLGGDIDVASPMHRQREASRTPSGRSASAHVFEDAIGAGQAVRTEDL